MKLLTKALEAKLIENRKANLKGTKDFPPVVKLFGGAACTWLLSEYDQEDGLFFGLCDLGMGFPELGYVSREELESVKFPPFGLPVERDLHFECNTPMSELLVKAKAAGRIVL